jgi:hypothetical protein
MASASGSWAAEGQVQKHTHHDCAMVQGQGVREFVSAATGSLNRGSDCSRAPISVSMVRDAAVPVVAIRVSTQQQQQETGSPLRAGNGWAGLAA